MEDMIPCSIKDQEVFQRVWQRVMEGRDQESSPIQPGIPGGWEGDVPCRCLEALMRLEGSVPPPECVPDQSEPSQPESPPAEPEAPAEPEPPMESQPEEPPVQAPEEEPQPEPDQPVPDEPCGVCVGAEGLPEEGGRHRETDLPRLWEGSQSGDDRTARLRCHVMDTLEGWQFYRHLAKRARGADARLLNSMAAEQHKEARKLSASYFLLTGVRYWPTELLGAPAIPSYWGALRARHQAEQRQENAYRLAGDDWEDPDQLALYSELIDSCRRRCQQLRSLLEQG